METFDIVTHSKAKFELNKLIIDETITLDEWKSLGQSLRQVEGSVQFWIGDWARFGDKQGFTGRYVSPKVYDELEEITGYNRQTIQTFKSVAENTEETRDSLRCRKDIGFSKFREVSSLETDKQIEFLEKSADEGLTVKELRDEVKQFKNQNNEMTETKEPQKNVQVWQNSHVEDLIRRDLKRKAEDEIIALARRLKKDFKKNVFPIFIQVFTKEINK